MKLVYADSRQACSGAPTAFGPLLTFTAARTPAAGRGQVAGGIERKPAVCASPARLRPFPRAVAAPPFSGPRSRGTTEVHLGQPRQHRPSTRTARTPRMGPAPGGTTTALLPPMVTGDAQGCHLVAGAGGSGCGRRPHSRCPGSSRAWLALMELRAVAHIRCPASVGRRTYPGLPALAPELACAQRRTAATGRKQPLTMESGNSRVARNAVEQLT